MKHIVILAAAALLSLPACADPDSCPIKTTTPAADQPYTACDLNLLRNGDFMPGTASNSPMDWRNDAPALSTNNIAAFEFFDGGARAAPAHEKFTMWQNVNALGFERVRFSGEVKPEGKLILKFSVLPCRESPPAPTKILHHVGFQSNGEWQTFLCETNLPAWAVALAVDLSVVDGAPFSLRNFRLEPVYPAQSAGQVRLGGRTALARIVVPPAPADGERQAAILLKNYLYKLSGAVAPVVAAAGAERSGSFFIGRAALAAQVIDSQSLDGLKDGGSMVVIGDEVAGLCGKPGDWGCVEAVFALLEQLGCRFYDLGEYQLPAKNGDLTLPRMDWKSAYSMRYAMAHVGDPWNKAAINLGYSYIPAFWGNCRELDFTAAYGSWVHTANFLAPHSRYLKEHPEYFALFRGQRGRLQKPSLGYVQLCWSNPDVQKLAIARVLQWIKKQPERKYFAVTPGDGTGYCECEACKAWDPDPAAVSKTDRYLRFVNIIARSIAAKYPDKRILALAYTVLTEAPPVEVKPEPNVDIMYCVWSSDWGCKYHAFCEKNREGMAHFEQWCALAPGRVHIFDYPWSAPADIARLQYFAQHNAAGVFHCGFRGRFQPLNTYLCARVFRDPEFDLERETDAFMQAYYGPAAKPVRAYYDMMNQAIAAADDHQTPCAPEPFYGHKDRTIITLEYARRGETLFEQALSAAEGDAKLIARIEVERQAFLRAAVNELNLTRGLETPEDRRDFALRLAELVKRLKASRPGAVYYRESPKVYLQRAARFEFGVQGKWYDDPVLDEFLKDPVAYIARERVDQQAVPGGWRIDAVLFWGGEGPIEYCKRPARIIRRASSDAPDMTANFILTNPLPAAAVVVITGMDDEKPGRAAMQVLVNDQVIFTGTNSMPEGKWGEQRIEAPGAAFKPGKNVVRIVNTTPDREEGVADMNFGAAGRIIQDYNWGWIGVNAITVLEGGNPAGQAD